MALGSSPSFRTIAEALTRLARPFPKGLSTTSPIFTYKPSGGSRPARGASRAKLTYLATSRLPPSASAGYPERQDRIAYLGQTNETSEGPCNQVLRSLLEGSEHRLLVRLRRIGAPTAVPLVPAVQGFSRIRDRTLLLSNASGDYIAGDSASCPFPGRPESVRTAARKSCSARTVCRLTQKQKAGGSSLDSSGLSKRSSYGPYSFRYTSRLCPSLTTRTMSTSSRIW